MTGRPGPVGHSNRSRDITWSPVPGGSGGGGGGRRLTYAGASISHSSEAPEVFEAYRQLALALSSFRAQVKKLDETNWLNCGTFAVAVLVFRLDHARRAPPGDFVAVVVDVLRALCTTTAMGDQMVAFLPVSHLADIGELEAVQRRRREQARIAEGALLEETLARMDVLLRRVELEVGQEAVLPSFHYRAPTTQGTDSSNDEVLENYNSGSGSSNSHGSASSSGGGNTGRAPVNSRLRAAAALRAWTEHICGRPRSWLHLISATSWTAHTSEGFISLVHEEDPVALVITLYWLVIMNRMNSRWFVDGWAVKAATVVLERIGPGWEDMIAWPIAEMGLFSMADVENNSSRPGA